MNHRLLVWILRAATAGAAVGAWLYATGPGHVSPLLLPALPDVLRTLASLLQTPPFWRDVEATLFEVVIAAAIASVTGLLFGFTFARFRFRTALMEPLLAWGYMVPLILFYPLFILWFDIGMWSKVGYAAVSAFFPIAYNSLRAFRAVDPRFLQVGRAFGASDWQIDRLIKFRAALPMVAAGIRIGAATALITVIVAEMLAAQRGLGYLLAQSSQTFQPKTAFATIVFVLILTGLIQFLVSRVLPVGYVPRTKSRKPGKARVQV